MSRVLVLGGGGREHALVEALLASPGLEAVWVAPGNAGTEDQRVELDPLDGPALVDFAGRHGVDLVVVGPEAPLVAGVTDELSAAGVAVFGPSAAAARLEGSKAWARDFAERHGIPGPRSAAFDSLTAAERYLDEIEGPVVIKASGLAAGKGVILPETTDEARAALRSLMVEGAMGGAGSTVVIEERLSGPEVSLLAFCDGQTVAVMPAAQDHKRVFDGDRGPNTGGMGAFAPTPTAQQVDELTELFLARAVDAMAAEGTPYVGVLYAGLMLTEQGPRLLEWNCRFGDPEAQVLLPLLETPLLALVEACAAGRLAEVDVEWSSGAAATVVMASEGYPGSYPTGRRIRGLEHAAEVATVFHAGTRLDQGETVTAGGRVLAVTGTGPDLNAALERAYEGVGRIEFEGAHYRRDIGSSLVATSAAATSAAYARAGVDLAAGDEAVARLATAVASTHDARVLRGVGAFGGALSLAELAHLDDPVMVASTDGVGTKTLLAAQLDAWDGIGADIVNHGVNDVLVQGARPLFFLDSVAAGRLDPAVVERIVTSMAGACRASGTVLLGGETAELPGVMTPDGVDVAGTLVGVVERSRLLPGPVAPGHLLVGLASHGLHTNGYSLARQAVEGLDLAASAPGGSECLGWGPVPVPASLGEALLVPHRCYLDLLEAPLEAGLVDGLVHVTGGGLPANLPRALPAGCGARVDLGSWSIPPLFAWLMERTGVELDEATRIWNLGIGMVVMVAPDRVEALVSGLGEPAAVIGEVVEGSGVRIEGPR